MWSALILIKNIFDREQKEVNLMLIDITVPRDEAPLLGFCTTSLGYK